MKFAQHALLSVICLATWASAGPAQAASISFGQPSFSVGFNQEFTATLRGRDFTDDGGGTLGGGFSLDWDENLIELLSYNTDPFPGDKVFRAAPPQDNVTGRLSNVSVLSSITVATTADFDIVTFTFRSKTTRGTTGYGLTIGQLPGGADDRWFAQDGITLINGDGVSLFVDG